MSPYLCGILQDPGPPLLLPPHQALPEIKAILIALQRPYLARPPSLRVRLLSPQHAPIPRDAQHSCSHATLRLERNGLPRVQPVPVVSLLQVFGKALAAELRVDGLETSYYSRQQGFQMERRRIRG